MMRSHTLIVVILLLSLSVVAQQVSPGLPPYATFGGGPFDVVNLGNLNVHFSIPVLHKAGRGLPFSYDLSYDSSIWTPVTSSGTTKWQPSTAFGWAGLGAYQAGTITYSTTTLSAPCNPPNPQLQYATVYYNYAYHEPNGTAHPFTLATSTGPQPGCSLQPAWPPTSGGAGANDGSGYIISANLSAATLYTKAGKTLNLPINLPGGSSKVTDSNGNQITTSTSGVFTDTLGLTALTVSGGAPNNLTFTYPAPSGNASVTVSYKSYKVKTNFGCSFGGEYPETQGYLVDKVTMPDSKAYSFAYEATAGTPLDTTGRLAQVTLPTGGSITYSYPLTNNGTKNGINCTDGSAPAAATGSYSLTRTLSTGGQSQYARNNVSGSGPGSNWKTTVTDPASNDTVLTFAEDTTQTNSSSGSAGNYNFYEIQRKVYQGSATSGSLLLTTFTCYNGVYANCTTSPVTVTGPITQADYYSQPSGGQWRLSEVKYNGSFSGSGLVSDDKEYDYGVTTGAAPGTTKLIRETSTAYASLGNNVSDRPSSITVSDWSSGSQITLSSTTYVYDGGTPTPTSGTPQHISISGSRGDLTTLTMSVNGSSSLSKTFSYYDTGNVNVATDVNGGQTTYTYGACGNSFPTSIAEPLSLSRSVQWNCTGGVSTQVTDESGNFTKADYRSDPDYWRPDSTTDLANNTTLLAYKTNSVESTLQVFNGGSSAWDFLTTVDGFGRVIYNQQLQAPPNGSNYDTVETDYNTLGQPTRSTMPYSATGSPANGNGSVAGTNPSYDALGRVVSVTKGTSSSTSYQASYQYIKNDVLITVGKSGGRQFKKQLEYDGLGRMTSVCEITTASGNGDCGQQNSGQSGFLTKYTYDAAQNNGQVNVFNVTQDAQLNAQDGIQTRTYYYDWLGRLTKEKNPESWITVYTWDYLASGMCGRTSQPGDLMVITNGDNSQICFVYDQLHRVTDEGGTVCRRFRYDNISNALFTEPAGYPGQNILGRLVEAETDTCGYPPTNQSWITDEWFSYEPNGKATRTYQATQNSNGFYHATAGYWQNGALASLQFLTPTQGLTPAIGYGLDAEGRINSVTSGSGQNPVTGVTYSPVAPLGAITKVTLGSGDYDSFTYDPNSAAMTQYSATIGTTPQTMTGTLTLSPNANGTIQGLAIVDPFNTNDNQSCSYTYDDLTRIASDTCTHNSSQVWGQTFSYDAFGNITKNGSDAWIPTYTHTLNQYAAGWTGGGSQAVSYDANGRLLNDTFNTYTWDTWGDLTSVNGGPAITYDAFGRMVENTSGPNIEQFVYSPTGGILTAAHEQILDGLYLPLPGGAIAMIGSHGPWQYNHPDWLGSARLFSSSTQAATPGFAYAPFGEGYAQSSFQWIQFTETGTTWTVGGNNNQGPALEDFTFRRYSPGQGRWISPDPAGLAAVDPTNPQTWNRYAYVTNNPLSFIDPLGLNRQGPGGSGCDPDHYDCGSGGGFPSDPSGGGSGCSPLDASCGPGSGLGQNVGMPPDYPGGSVAWDFDCNLLGHSLNGFCNGSGDSSQVSDPSNVFGGGKNQNPMPIIIHGNWCGPDWTGARAGEYDPAIDKAGGYSPPKDALDSACMQHDQCYYQCRQANPCDSGARSRCFAVACDSTLSNAAHNLAPTVAGTLIDIFMAARSTDMWPFQPNPYSNPATCQQ